MSFDYWKQAHDTLRLYHLARSRGAAREVLDHLWSDYKDAWDAADKAGSVGPEHANQQVTGSSNEAPGGLL